MNAVSILTQPSLTPPKEAGLLSSVQYFKKFFDIIICKNFGISYDTVYTDKWDSFIAVFQADNHIVGKENTQGIEGNNCRLRHRIRRAYRKTCVSPRNFLII